MKLVVNILDNELWSSKARINFSKEIGHVVKLQGILFYGLHRIKGSQKILSVDFSGF